MVELLDDWLDPAPSSKRIHGSNSRSWSCGGGGSGDCLVFPAELVAALSKEVGFLWLEFVTPDCNTDIGLLGRRDARAAGDTDGENEERVYKKGSNDQTWRDSATSRSKVVWSLLLSLADFELDFIFSQLGWWLLSNACSTNNKQSKRLPPITTSEVVPQTSINESASLFELIVEFKQWPASAYTTLLPSKRIIAEASVYLIFRPDSSLAYPGKRKIPPRSTLRMSCNLNEMDARNATGEGGTVSVGPVVRLVNPGLPTLEPLRLLTFVVGLSAPAGLLASRKPDPHKEELILRKLSEFYAGEQRGSHQHPENDQTLDQIALRRPSPHQLLLLLQEKKHRGHTIPTASDIEA
nr:hypothetical protein Iba_chr12bCG1070 [Ipomoea batatas]